jgi:hypothetical protein
MSKTDVQEQLRIKNVNIDHLVIMHSLISIQKAQFCESGHF